MAGISKRLQNSSIKSMAIGGADATAVEPSLGRKLLILLEQTSMFSSNLVRVPAPAARPHPGNPTFANLGGEQRAEPVPPKPHRFVADLDAAFVQQILNIWQGQRAPDVLIAARWAISGLVSKWRNGKR
jgi:hypothetical protein